MTKKELNLALNGAVKGDYDRICDKFDGFGLPEFVPVACTIRELSALVAWQCIQLNGDVDGAALDEIWQCRRKFIVVG